MLEILRDADHPEHREWLEWLGHPFDPEDFDPGAVVFDNPRRRLKLARQWHGF